LLSPETAVAVLTRLVLTIAALTASWAAWAGRANDTLVAAFPREVRTLDGNYANLRENDILGLLVDDALFAVDPNTGAAVPLAAKGHQLANQVTLDVDLREDVLFHDGSQMTAEDVVYTYTYLLDEKNGNSYQDRFDRWLRNVEPLGRFKVRFNMKRAYAMALYDLAMYSKIRKKGTYDDATKPGGFNAEAQLARLNGTGPYRVTGFQLGQRITLERFDKYRKGSVKEPAIRNITIRIIRDWSTQVAEVMAGGVNWTFGVPADLAADAARSGRAQTLDGPSMRVFYLSLDAAGKVQKDGPLTKLAVRQALNHAVDREGIVKNLIKGKAKVIHTACDPVQFGCDESVVKRYPYDPARARALLAQAGYANGFDIELWGARDKPVTEAIVAQWRAVGVRATLRDVPGATLSQARREGKVAVEFSSSGSFGIPDAGALLPDRLGPDSDRNYSGDAALAETILQAVSSNDEQVRKRHFRSALARIAEQAYWVPLYVDSQNFVMTPDLAFTQPGDGMPRLYTARWK
jgi:peptide/nickel transport system substrate-binding protein